MAEERKQDKTHTLELSFGVYGRVEWSFEAVKVYLEDRKMLTRWKNRALYFTWNTEASSRLYSFL